MEVNGERVMLYLNLDRRTQLITMNLLAIPHRDPKRCCFSGL